MLEPTTKTNMFSTRARLAAALPLLLVAASGASCSCGGAKKAAVEAGVPGDTADAGAPDAGPPAVDLVAAGRALEAGDLERAQALAPPTPTTPEELLLAARLAAATGDHERAATLYRALAGAREDLEQLRRLGLLAALASGGKLAEAVVEARAVLEPTFGLSPGQRRQTLEDLGGWLIELGRPAEAIDPLTQARKAATGRIGDRIALALARAHVAAGRPLEARRILEPLAEDAASAKAMRDAVAALEELGRTVKWTPKQRIERAERLMELRAWDDAAALLAPLTAAGDGTFNREARWLEARLLYQRRRHYAEAIAAFDKVIAAGGPPVDEARFLRARALSRLDRDDEAIAAYREFAAQTKRRARADEARFLACRLEFFLGRHAAAVAGLERLVGSGAAPAPGKGQRRPKPTKSTLTPERTRDAHFLAGLAALLDGDAARAAPHLVAASEGSKSDEAIARNSYWHAVAKLATQPGDGADLLRGICKRDPTDWYSLMARRRLAADGQPLGACDPAVLAAIAEPPPATVELEQLAPLAAFLARAGLYREAAAELRRAEQAGKVKAAARDWIAAYNALDAPHHAIRRAARGLGWPPDPEDGWQARAAYPTPYLELVRATEDELGLPRHLIHSIARKESLFDPHAISWVGALGMMQMMPHTYETNRKRAGLPPLAEGETPGPEQSIRAAGHELAHLLERFDGSLPLAVMAYNGGAAAVSRWVARSGGLPIDVFVEKGGFAQTRNYVRRVYKNLLRYSLLAGDPPPAIPETVGAGAAPDAGVDGGPPGVADAGAEE